MTERSKITTILIILASACSQSVFSDWLPKYSVRGIYDDASDNKLGMGVDKNNFSVWAADLRYGGRWLNNKGLSLDIMSRFYLASGKIITSSDASENTSSRRYAELKQLNLSQTFDKNYGQWWVSIGRTRIRESTGLLWDKDIEGFAFGFDSSLLKAELRISEQLRAWRSDKSDYQNDDKKRTYLSGFLDWQWYYGHHLRFLMVAENDHSGVPEIGTLFASDDLDRTDRKALWTGLELLKPVQKNWSYRIAAMAVTGEDRRLTYLSEGSSRRVSGQQKYDLSGWLLDTSVQWQLPVASQLLIEPTLGIGYTLTSKGTTDNNSDKGFVQPGLASNRYRMNESGLAMHRTGEAYRLDLSNVSVFSARLGLKSKDWLAGIQWNHLNRRNDRADVGSSNISADLLPGKSHLGQSLDLQLVWKPSIKKLWGGFDAVQYRLRGGWFKAGDAYGSAKGETRTRIIFDITLRHSAL